MLETTSKVAEQKDLTQEPPMMTMPPLLPLEEVLAEFHAFNQSFKSVVLGTVNGLGDADATYAPTLQIQGKFYVYVSELAAHTANLVQHPKVSLLFIEPETEANLFRRRRSSIRAHVCRIARESEAWEEILDCYEEQLGKMMRNLRGLKDFHLFELTPIEASFVRGFGQAYRVTGEKLSEISHVNDRGHGKTLFSENPK
jgi:putative heme iron utilization protein